MKPSPEVLHWIPAFAGMTQVKLPVWRRFPLTTIDATIRTMNDRQDRPVRRMMTPDRTAENSTMVANGLAGVSHVHRSAGLMRLYAKCRCKL